MKGLFTALISFTTFLSSLLMICLPLTTQASELRAMPAPITDRGSISIPEKVFPEGKGNPIQIYVPPVIEGSNATIKDDWKTVSELKGLEINKAATVLAGLEIFKGIFGPGKGDPAKAKQLLDIKTEYQITIQESPKGDFRALIQTSGADRTVQDIAGSLINTKGIKEGSTITQVTFDRDHKDDPYIGYVSLSPDKKTIEITPKVYPQDKAVIKNTFLGIPTTTVMEVSGEALVNFLTPSFKSGIDVGLLEKMFSDEKIMTAMSVIRMDDKTTLWEQIKDKVKAKANEFIKKQVVSVVLKETLSLSALPVKIGVGVAWPKTVLAPTTDASKLSELIVGNVNKLDNVSPQLVNVSHTSRSISFTFSEPMGERFHVNISGFGAGGTWSDSWSNNRKTYTTTYSNTFTSGSTINYTINPDPDVPPQGKFSDLSKNPATTTTGGFVAP